jgi:hypothetical protein
MSASPTRPGHEAAAVRRDLNVDSVGVSWRSNSFPSVGKTGTILDGHHRYHVGLRIGLSRLPVIMVDYLNDAGIELDVWPASGLSKLTKAEVIDMALSDAVYPPKTSRHRFSDHLPPIAVPLDLLRIED